ncbi:uncharacterized protein LOC120701151, partial [Panicum virgatum]|uniref:uncharacterized protein LOC120701151 n=1 Tax=Panicum virgatum TaxID=38727 RepID=UPI0019D63D9D
AAAVTAAECAAVCCCFPCAVVELAVLAAVRVPAALCRRAIRARRRRRRAARAAQARRKEMDDLVAADATDRNGVAMDLCYWAPKHDDLAEVEKEVWASFQGAGFWRSPSQREERR